MIPRQVVSGWECYLEIVASGWECYLETVVSGWECYLQIGLRWQQV
jgi:hypothetical protein